MSGEGRRSRILAEVTCQFELAHQVGDRVEIDDGMVTRRIDITESAIDCVAFVEAMRARRGEEIARSLAGSARQHRRHPSASGCGLAPTSELIDRHQGIEAAAHVLEKSSRRGNLRGEFRHTLLHDGILGLDDTIRRRARRRRFHESPQAGFSHAEDEPDNMAGRPE